MAADTIAAIATPPGFGGIGVVRVSGTKVRLITEAILGRVLEPRLATLAWFRDEEGEALDQGLALFFPAPHSFTGEDVLEIQGHGGPLVQDLLLRRLLSLGARLARPGEFSERAFLNGKLDLTQAEAVADLIASSTEDAARLAGRNLSGEFSRRIHSLVENLIDLRTFVEAALDFPEEEVDFIANSGIAANLDELMAELDALLRGARQGCLIREGIQIVIAGPPNVGKSSLLNALSGTDSAIVTAVPGTTRDLLHREIQIDGLPLHIIDTAGLRHSDDLVEIEGIRRAQDQIEKADVVLWLSDDSSNTDTSEFEFNKRSDHIPVILVRNKIDLSGRQPGLTKTSHGTEIAISAREGTGLDSLRTHLKQVAGYQEKAEGIFLARRRHLDALANAREALTRAHNDLKTSNTSELAAEEMRLAQKALSEITGEFTSDDLLGRIFSSFCLGK